jgi:phosphoenolpyruvate-protein kinase (PTS system EI component)
MRRALRFVGKIRRESATLPSVFLAVAVVWIDVITGREIQFPLVYVLPVGLAAWRQQRILAYGMALTLPVLRIGFEVSWETTPSLVIGGINTLIDITAMLLYAYLVGRTAAQTRRLQKTVTTRELESTRLRAFTTHTSPTLQGRGLSPGLAEGVVLISLPPESEGPSAHQALAPEDVEAEINRLDRAVAAAIRELDTTQTQCAPDMAAAESALLKDGVHIGLYANICRPDEAHRVREYRLEGVGLYRSEYLFLGVERPPDLDTQFAAYAAVATLLDPCPVVIRTMDLGGEKIPRFARPETDWAPRTGKRGLAFALAEKQRFRTQLQAILRAAQGGDVRIMFPLVIGVADLMEARHLVEEVIETEHLAKRPSLGAMIETPAAVLHIQEIVPLVDFVSIGTNDLAHFILATDRQSQESSGVLSFLHPSVLRATDQVVRAALKQGVGLTVCGEAAGNPEAVCLLVGMGVRALSMDPLRAARVGHVLHQVTLEQMGIAFKAALGATTPEDVQQIAVSALRGTDM